MQQKHKQAKECALKCLLDIQQIQDTVHSREQENKIKGIKKHLTLTQNSVRIIMHIVSLFCWYESMFLQTKLIMFSSTSSPIMRFVSK